MAQLAGTSQEAFEDFYFNVCTLDYQKMSKAMDPLVDLMNRTDKVRLVGPDTASRSRTVRLSRLLPTIPSASTSFWILMKVHATSESLPSA